MPLLDVGSGDCQAPADPERTFGRVMARADDHDKWPTFIKLAIDAVAMVRSGSLDPDTAFRTLYDLALHHFAVEDDPRTKRLCQAVLHVVKHCADRRTAS